MKLWKAGGVLIILVLPFVFGAVVIYAGTDDEQRLGEEIIGGKPPAPPPPTPTPTSDAHPHADAPTSAAAGDR